jgi:6-pyruvoyltetrahydropterin/6-carboxytetrahydropterin synthase
MRVELVKEFLVEAAHRNANAGGPAARLHGHSFRIEIIVEGEVDPAIGWLIDYGVIKEAFRPLYEKLDHSYLNEIEGMNDAALEDVAAWIEERLTVCQTTTNCAGTVARAGCDGFPRRLSRPRGVLACGRCGIDTKSG